MPNREVIELDGGDSSSDWMSLLKDLKKESRGAKPEAKKEKTVEELAEERKLARARYEKLCKTPSMRMEQADMMVLSEFSEIIASVNQAGKLVGRLQSRFPDYINERMIHVCRENLKETATVMLKEFHTLRHGRQQKKYDKRCICRKCHNIFMVPLPGDGICDECRASQTPRSAPY